MRASFGRKKSQKSNYNSLKKKYDGLNRERKALIIQTAWRRYFCAKRYAHIRKTALLSEVLLLREMAKDYELIKKERDGLKSELENMSAEVKKLKRKVKKQELDAYSAAGVKLASSTQLVDVERLKEELSIANSALRDKDLKTQMEVKRYESELDVLRQELRQFGNEDAIILAKKASAAEKAQQIGEVEKLRENEEKNQKEMELMRLKIDELTAALSKKNESKKNERSLMSYENEQQSKEENEIKRMLMSSSVVQNGSESVERTFMNGNNNDPAWNNTQNNTQPAVTVTTSTTYSNDSPSVSVDSLPPIKIGRKSDLDEFIHPGDSSTDSANQRPLYKRGWRLIKRCSCVS